MGPTVSMIMQVCSFITSLAAAIAILAKPLREKLFGTKKIEEGQKCVLRAKMLDIYYRGKDNGEKIRQYDFENFVLMYAAYKELGGNGTAESMVEQCHKLKIITAAEAVKRDLDIQGGKQT